MIICYEKKPEKQLLYTDILIRTKYNSDLPEAFLSGPKPEAPRRKDG